MVGPLTCLHLPMPLEVVAEEALLGICDKFGESCGVWWSSSAAFTVDVEVDRPKPLVKGARCVSFSSGDHRQSRCHQTHLIGLLLVNFHDILPTCRQADDLDT